MSLEKLDPYRESSECHDVARILVWYMYADRMRRIKFDNAGKPKGYAFVQFYGE